MKVRIILILLIIFLPAKNLRAQQSANKPEKEQWFMDIGFGMFIHWSLDSQVGAVISHSMAGASEDYLIKFINDLPATFNPRKFYPDDWAVLANLAGMKYVVFTAKHHSGFCMWDTKTTDFCIMNTPFRRDILREILDAFRRQNIAVGIYFSPEDFYFFHKNNIPVGRLQDPMHYPANNKALMEYDKAQVKELLTNYGKIDILFFDGPAEGLKEFAWQLQPDVVVTRGQMETPEQNIPDKPLPGPWEACFTMGTDWQYKPTNDPHKSGTEIINMLIETRAKGGNLLLNVGPKPDGELQIEQEALLREVALWNLVNGESIHDIRPWEIIREGDVWFTGSKDRKAVYAYIPGGPEWKFGERKEFVFRTLEGSKDTRVSILGYASELLEYRPGFDAGIYISPTPIGLVVSAVNGQRLYTNYRWPNPVVMKIENVKFRSPASEQGKQDSVDGAK
jgi:alpha-L-fucosidase